jgi:serine/threonine protein phosphatase PrpC
MTTKPASEGNEDLATATTQPIVAGSIMAALEEPPAPADVPEGNIESEHTGEIQVDPRAETIRAPAIPIAGMPVYHLAHAVRTHTGLVRDHNEDDYLIREDHGLYLVADGMGGHAAGKVASKICVDTCEKYFNEAIGTSYDGTNGLSPAAAELENSLRSSNRAIFDASTRDPALAGMGTTAVGLRISSNMVTVCHAGDSRCYLLREGRFRQVTVDHSLSNFLLAMGRELEARLAEATMSNVIMRALGLEPDVIIDTQEFQLRSGDRMMLCSDGLSDLVASARLERMLTDPSLDRESLAEALIQAALDAGGRDNITVLIVDVLDRLDGREDTDDDLDRTIPSGIRLDDTFEQTSPGFDPR